MAMTSRLITGATIIDGVLARPIEGQSIWIEGTRIKALGRRDEVGAPASVEVIDARGKWVIPGLMNANVHLLGDMRLEHLVRYMDRYEDLIAEAAQVALKNGLTTVFDTYGPRRFLMNVRDRAAAGELPGSRFFCAGNIIGFDGPCSHDFYPKAMEVASTGVAKRLNAILVENVGRHLMWLTPEQVSQEVRCYIEKGIDFVKYASNEHFGNSSGAFLQFSPRVQELIVEEAHRAGTTAQAHTMSVEGLRLAVEAGCDLIQHANHTGPALIPETTLELMARRKVGTVVFPQTQKRLDFLTSNENYRTPSMWRAADTNVRNLMRCGAPILLANDGTIPPQEALVDPSFIKNWGGPWEGNLYSLADGHFTWFEAMEEKGYPPMEMLKAATRNIAIAYRKDCDLGTLEPGKLADLLILDRDPLQAARNYRAINLIMKDGVPVERDALPLSAVLTKPMDPPVLEEASYVSFSGGNKFPMCPMCLTE